MTSQDTQLHLETDGPLACIWLDGPDRRNALSRSTMSSLVDALHQLETQASVSVVLIRGRGSVFCSGFDLGPAVEDPTLLDEFISGLGDVLKTIRRHRAVVMAGIHGAAIAGGCAIASACDLTVISPETRLGYPVHGLGLSPIVSSSTLSNTVGDGACRSLLLSGKIIDGSTAFRIGLASHLAQDAIEESLKLAHRIAGHGQHALEKTKAWLNELDGSLCDDRFDGPVNASAPLSSDQDSIAMLRENWSRS